jgi:hypothetical protein
VSVATGNGTPWRATVNAPSGGRTAKVLVHKDLATGKDLATEHTEKKTLRKELGDLAYLGGKFLILPTSG